MSPCSVYLVPSFLSRGQTFLSGHAARNPSCLPQPVCFLLPEGAEQQDGPKPKSRCQT